MSGVFDKMIGRLVFRHGRLLGALLLGILLIGAWGISAAHEARAFQVRAYPLLVRQPINEPFLQGDVRVATVGLTGWRDWERRGYFRTLGDESNGTFGVFGAGNVQIRQGEIGILIMTFAPEPRFTQLALDSIVCRNNSLVLAFSEWFDDPGPPDPLIDAAPYNHHDYRTWLIVVPETRLPFARPWPGVPGSAFGLATKFERHNRRRERSPSSFEQRFSCS